MIRALPYTNDQPHLVKIEQHMDNRGVFTEVFSPYLPYLVDFSRPSEGLFIKQVMVSMSYSGVIRGMHSHSTQWDFWYLLNGSIWVQTYYVGKESINEYHHEFFLNGNNGQILIIPPGHAHGYKTLGNKPCTMLYGVSEPYDRGNPDEIKHGETMDGLITW